MDFLLTTIGIFIFCFYLGEFFSATIVDEHRKPKIFIILILSLIMFVLGISWNIFVERYAEWKYAKTEIIHTTEDIEYENPMRCEIFVKEYSYSIKSNKIKKKCKVDEILEKDVDKQ